MPNKATTGWNSKMVPCAKVPIGICCWTQPLETQYAISPAIDRLVGMGNPSKYLALPLASFGTFPVVTLKRANLARPESTKQVKRSWSRGVRMPSAKAHEAGATPNEIYKQGISWVSSINSSRIYCTKSARESNSAPIKLLFLRMRATMPSKKSKKRPNGMNPRAAHTLPV